MKITDLAITPIAFADPPLLNATGVHEPLALRTVVQLHVADGVVGLGEGSGELVVLERLARVRPALVGQSVFDTSAIEAIVFAELGNDVPPIQKRSVFSIIEVACLDAQGKLLGLPVVDLLGGAVRQTVTYSGYLFYKWAGHPGQAADEWGEALDPAGLVAQAARMIDLHGFGSLKLKGGVFPPDQEIAAVRALAEAFPGIPLRIDPNGAWSVATSQYVAAELAGVLEYLEDPTLTTPAMAQVAAAASMPLATNMCVVSPETVPEAIRLGAVQIVLSDHHYWGGLRHTRELGALCATFGLGLSMHSNSHLGISLAAMTHVAAATPNLAYACDTHYPWNSGDDVITVPFEFADGALRVPAGPGLGVELDEAKLFRLHRQYVASGRTTRADTAYLRQVDPAYDPSLPRF
ncbi:Mandelate racemase/muconate lactonizing protein [Kribbella flavida DSM 17836]|uniref:glucarate dehydratase n=1 Tax=Kribbella flavida (strain DSM 17836 / JCM 10339 / NBRC 14399) TaxID=479435 RepID=D2Q238_KRIFD|nr:enolase C-terminal domain-like protein [Kribbella flavida]ADB33984.1 Mandelate racemase/muconate lactonizing protein [Kribbella flavida DSM 17836]